jgi:Ca2+-binding RTX toxin-like protein
MFGDDAKIRRCSSAAATSTYLRRFGNDTMYSQAGVDLIGNAGDDNMQGSDGNDRMAGDDAMTVASQSNRRQHRQ